MLTLEQHGGMAVERGDLPIRQDGAVVATLRRDRPGSAVATVGDRTWLFWEVQRLHLAARLGEDAAHKEHLWAVRTSYLRNGWELDLESRRVTASRSRFFRNTHRYEADGVRLGHSSGDGRRRTALDMDGSVPLDHQEFVLWVESISLGLVALERQAISGEPF